MDESKNRCPQAVFIRVLPGIGAGALTIELNTEY
jgi:hypothetical protein